VSDFTSPSISNFEQLESRTFNLFPNQTAARSFSNSSFFFGKAISFWLSPFQGPFQAKLGIGFFFSKEKGYWRPSSSLVRTQDCGSCNLGSNPSGRPIPFLTKKVAKNRQSFGLAIKGLA
jgi:hypothetical protein